MAKLTGPLFSLDARGKLGKALVFIGWKGIKTVRQWLKPANPQSTAQQNIRTIFGGIGRAVGKAQKNSVWHVLLKAKEVIPDQQSKQSYLVQYIKDKYIVGKGATMTTAFATMLAEVAAHTASAAFATEAAGLGILDFSLPKDDIAVFSKRLGLYLLAKASFDLALEATPYSTTFTQWTASEVASMAADMTTEG